VALQWSTARRPVGAPSPTDGWPGPRRPICLSPPANPRKGEDRDHGASGPPVLTLYLGPAELAALRAAVGAYLHRASQHHRVLEELYELFTGRGSERR
jgi:hypothetical protein